MLALIANQMDNCNYYIFFFFFCRFRKIISKWIQEKEVKKFAKFSNNSKKEKEARKRKVLRFFFFFFLQLIKMSLYLIEKSNIIQSYFSSGDSKFKEN